MVWSGGVWWPVAGSVEVDKNEKPGSFRAKAMERNLYENWESFGKQCFQGNLVFDGLLVLRYEELSGMLSYSC